MGRSDAWIFSEEVVVPDEGLVGDGGEVEAGDEVA